MKQIVTCQICAEGVSFSCSHHRNSYTSLIFITRFQNWFLQQKTSLPLWKSNYPILMYLHLLYYRQDNVFSYQTNYDVVDRSPYSLEFPTWLSCKIKMRKSMFIMHHFSVLFFLFVFLLFLWKTDDKTNAIWRLIRPYKNLYLYGAGLKFEVRSIFLNYNDPQLWTNWHCTS